MKKLIIPIIAITLLSSCAQKPLYTWGNYETTSYNYLKNSDEKSEQQIIENYQIIIENQKGTRGVVPPGVYADYGFLLLQQDKPDEGKEMLLKEMALYPESRVFIELIIKMIEE